MLCVGVIQKYITWFFIEFMQLLTPKASHMCIFSLRPLKRRKQKRDKKGRTELLVFLPHCKEATQCQRALAVLLLMAKSEKTTYTSAAWQYQAFIHINQTPDLIYIISSMTSA